MTTQKHTPGPWYATEGYIRQECDASVIAKLPDSEWQVYGDMRHTGGDAADARLIAAAPELLEALQNFMRLGTMDDQDAIDAARAAIAKAEGR